MLVRCNCEQLEIINRNRLSDIGGVRASSPALLLIITDEEGKEVTEKHYKDSGIEVM